MACWHKVTLIFIAWAVIFPTFLPEVSAQETGTTSTNGHPASCSEDHSCLQTSGCLIPRAQHQSPSLIGILSNSQEHVAGLMEEFQISLQDLTADVLDAWGDWRSSILNLRVPEIGLRALYPTIDNTTQLTLALPGTRSPVLRELRWWMTSIESHMQVLYSSGFVQSASELDRKTTYVSEKLSRLLAGFGIHSQDLPLECVCVRTSSATTDSVTQRATFVSMALRDIHRALAQMVHVLQGCDVLEPCGGSGEAPCEPNHRRRRHPRLHCGGRTASAFYPQVPSDIVFLYHHSHFLSE